MLLVCYPPYGSYGIERVKAAMLCLHTISYRNSFLKAVIACSTIEISSNFLKADPESTRDLLPKINCAEGDYRDGRL